MREGLLILAACLISLGCGIGLGFDLARRRREAEREATMRRLLRDIRNERPEPMPWQSAIISRSEGLAWPLDIDAYCGKTVEPSDDR